MRLPQDRKAELYVEGLKQIAASGENDFRRFLLAECLEAYVDLDEAQKERLQELLHTEAYREAEPLMKTTYERGIEGSTRIRTRHRAGRATVDPAANGSQVRTVVCRSQATGRGFVTGIAGPNPDRSARGTVPRGTPPDRLTHAMAAGPAVR